MHNHPSGDPTPSRADIEMTQAIIEVAKPLGIAVHDHIIVGRDGHASRQLVRWRRGRSSSLHALQPNEYSKNL